MALILSAQHYISNARTLAPLVIATILGMHACLYYIQFLYATTEHLSTAPTTFTPPSNSYTFKQTTQSPVPFDSRSSDTFVASVSSSEQFSVDYSRPNTPSTPYKAQSERPRVSQTPPPALDVLSASSALHLSCTLVSAFFYRSAISSSSLPGLRSVV